MLSDRSPGRMATCTIRFLYAAENREFTFKDVAATQQIRAIKQAIVEKWPTGECPTPGAPVEAPTRGAPGEAPSRATHGREGPASSRGAARRRAGLTRHSRANAPPAALSRRPARRLKAGRFVTCALIVCGQVPRGRKGPAGRAARVHDGHHHVPHHCDVAARQRQGGGQLAGESDVGRRRRGRSLAPGGGRAVPVRRLLAGGARGRSRRLLPRCGAGEAERGGGPASRLTRPVAPLRAHAGARREGGVVVTSLFILR